MIPSGWQLAVLLLIAGTFLHFSLFAMQTFVFESPDTGASVGQVSFMGALIVAGVTGFYHKINPWPGIAAVLLLACSVGLYEWTRRTVRGQRFRTAFSEHVPAELCETGPYAHIRHPFYVSYLIAFTAIAVALPSWWTAALLAANAGIFVLAALSDERAMSRSGNATAYADYKRRVGRFLPRLPVS